MPNIALSEKKCNKKMPSVAIKILTNAINSIILKSQSAMNGIEKGGDIMYRNLRAEMVKLDISNDDISKLIHKDARTVRNRMSGATDFTFSETILIRDSFFPKMKLEYLFKRDEKLFEQSNE